MDTDISVDVVDTFQADIYVGYKETLSGIVHTKDEVEAICQQYVDNNKECVSIQEVTYVYTNGKENGVKVTFIDFPRFPRDHETITMRALDLASILADKLNQCRVTVVASDGNTYMINNKKAIDELIASRK